MFFWLALYGKTAIKQLKDAVLDFYTTEDICHVKENILYTVDSWKSGLNLPHIPSRRDACIEVIGRYCYCLTCLEYLDENLKLKCLLKYVADSPDTMPSIRICDGDLLSLMAAFDKLKERMSAAEAVLTTILQAVDTMKDLLLTPSVHVHSVSANNLQKQPVPRHPQSKLDNMSQVRSSVATRAGNNDSAELGNPSYKSGDPGRSWAVTSEAASTPTTSNRYTVLQDINDDCVGSDSQDETPLWFKALHQTTATTVKATAAAATATDPAV